MRAVEFALSNIYPELRSTGSRRVLGSFHFESPFSIGGNIYRYLPTYASYARYVPACHKSGARRYICKDEHLHNRCSVSMDAEVRRLPGATSGKNSRHLYRARSFGRAFFPETRSKPPEKVEIAN